MLIILTDMYTGTYTEGIQFNISLIINAPSYFALFALIGINNAMHFTPQYVFKILNFLFYFFSIAVIQLIYVKLINRYRK